MDKKFYSTAGAVFFLMSISIRLFFLMLLSYRSDCWLFPSLVCVRMNARTHVHISVCTHAFIRGYKAFSLVLVVCATAYFILKSVCVSE